MADEDHTPELCAEATSTKEERKKLLARERYLRHRAKDPNRYRALQRARYERNRERCDAQARAWAENNHDRLRAMANARYRKKAQDPQFRIGNILRCRLYKLMRAEGGPQWDLKAEELVGCSLTIFRRHLENQFKSGMSWENYGKWELDHVRPIAAHDLTDPEQQKACFAYTNIQPLWGPENRKKRTRLDWKPE